MVIGADCPPANRWQEPVALVLLLLPLPLHGKNTDGKRDGAHRDSVLGEPGVSAHLPWFSKNAVALGAVALSVGVLAACSGSSSSSSRPRQHLDRIGQQVGGRVVPAPITIGASLSLTGDFAADGQAFQQGYDLWVKDVNAAGGILGRQVKLTILDDNSDPNQVVTNYQTLINTDHVDLTFGPFSSLLTAPASAVAARNGYAFVEGAGGAPSVFDTPSNQADHNTFDVSLPVADALVPFVNYIASLRPRSGPRPLPTRRLTTRSPTRRCSSPSRSWRRSA